VRKNKQPKWHKKEFADLGRQRDYYHDIKDTKNFKKYRNKLTSSIRKISVSNYSMLINTWFVLIAFTIFYQTTDRIMVTWTVSRNTYLHDFFWSTCINVILHTIEKIERTKMGEDGLCIFMIM
jgi:hypothetical protein